MKINNLINDLQPFFKVITYYNLLITFFCIINTTTTKI